MPVLVHLADEGEKASISPPTLSVPIHPINFSVARSFITLNNHMKLFSWINKINKTNSNTIDNPMTILDEVQE